MKKEKVFISNERLYNAIVADDKRYISFLKDCVNDYEKVIYRKNIIITVLSFVIFLGAGLALLKII